MEDDETTPDEGTVEHTPDESGPAETTPEETTDWKQRYESLQPEYTRSRQEVSRLSHLEQVLQSDDQQALNDALQQYGWGAGEDTEEEAPADDFEFHDPRVDGLLVEREQAQMQQQIAQLETHVTNSVDQLASQNNLELSDKQKGMIANYALTLEPGADNNPDVAKAFEEFTGIRDEIIKGYRTSKRAPSPPPTGVSGTPERNLGSRKERVAAAMEIANEAFSGNE